MRTAPRFRGIRFIIGSIYCFFLFFSSAVFASEIISVGWEAWEPYQYRDEKQQLVGLDVEMITAIAKDAGFGVLFKELPWKRILMYVQNGQLDLTAGVSRVPEKEKYADFTEPYRTESAVMYIRKGTAGNYPFADLREILNSSFQLGAEAEYYYGRQYAELMKNPEFEKHIQVVTRGELNYNKLLKGRIDGFLVDPFAGAVYLKKNNLRDQIESHPMPVYSDSIYFMISKKTSSRDLTRRLNHSIKKLKASGALAEIINKWR